MKGTASQGKKSSGKSHIPCRRCGRSAYHVRKKACASCGYGKSKKLRNYSWQTLNR
ncbi:50S ribosomal protein L37e [Candidatus Woesearchaeota archaeon]|nr:50S ribosomal protein L37e [Candidatus Woesearchaeota archaeon]